MADIPSRSGLRLKTAPELAVLSASKLREHLQITHNKQDATVLEPLIDEAVALIQGRVRTQFTDSVWIQSFDKFSNPLALELPPVTSIVAVRYRDDDGEWATVSSDVYELDGNVFPALVHLLPGKSWPTPQAGRKNAIEVEFHAGYLSENDIPKEAKRAVKLLAGHWYENPGAVGQVGQPIELAFSACEDSLKWTW